MGSLSLLQKQAGQTKEISTKDAEPSENNAMRYFIDTANWAEQNEVPLFYFSSFDESWKVHHEGDVGARWGLWDKNENLKFQ